MGMYFNASEGQWIPTQPVPQSQSSSSGHPVVVQTPQSEYNLALAQQAGAAGNQLYNWAGQNYTQLQKLAGTAIPQYLAGAATSKDLADQQMGMWTGTYAPAMQRFNEMANSYSSPARQQYAMGQAEADATQASNAAWNNTKNDLQAHGIDPSSGMYAGLESAAHTAGGAAAAGAANQARQGVENTGIGLQEQNINFGQTLPASILNAENANYAGLAGAENTQQSTANTGANLYNTANNFYQTGMAGKLPTSGQETQGTASTTSTMMAHGGLVEPEDHYRRGGKVRRPKQQREHGGGGGGGHGGAEGDRSALTANGDGSFSPPGQAPIMPSPPGGSITHDRSSSTLIPGSPGSGTAPAPLPGDSNGLPTQQAGGGADTGGGIPDMGAAHGGPMDPNMWQPHGHQGRPHPPHPYHVNGLPDAATGGHVPYELSPSHGHTTDDVVANLNAGEFVIPRRTVHHLGHKFLYDLIGKSDKEMGLHPQPVGPSKVKPGSGAGKAREAAESQNFSAGGL